MPTSTGVDVPSQRQGHTAVWTGTEMIVWGGYGDAIDDITGGRYRPLTDTWTPTSIASGAPAARSGHTALWTGSEMIVWGGYGRGEPSELDTGSLYDPSSDSWTPTPAGSASARSLHTAIWTGTEMIVWGGRGTSTYPAIGGLYSPGSASWIPMASSEGVVAGRDSHTAIWTGTEMVIWGGDSPYATSTGGAYCACPSGRIVYRDADGDGYGNPLVSIPVCEDTTPLGFVVDHTDCNDADPSIHPGTAEICNGVDDDCNGSADDSGSALCNDGNACTADLCDPSSGCVHGLANMDTNDFSAGRVDGRDLVVLANAWNSCLGDAAYDAAANLDHTGCVDATDFHMFMTAFGQSCP